MPKRLVIACLTFILIDSCPIYAQKYEDIVINEIMVSNIDVYLDPSQNYGGWVELYNPSDMPIDLGGLFISNDLNALKQNRLVDNYGILPSKGYALLNFGHHDNFTKEGYRQIDAKLDCDGGVIIISDGNTIISQVSYPPALSRISYARIEDGSARWSFTGKPSPGYSNNNNGGYATEQLPVPSVSKGGCRFYAPFYISVAVPDGATLLFTTDGTCPTQTNGHISENHSFYIKETTCLRFRLFQDGYLPSNVVTCSYIKDDGNYPFPIISIVTDSLNFYDKERGLFEIGPYGRSGRYTSETYNSNMDWDRPVSFEYITEDNKCVIAQECDVAMTGGGSRMITPHSLKLKAKKQYDFNNTFPYQFFSEKPFLKHKSLLIRNGGDDRRWRVIDVAFQQMIAKSGIRVNYQAFEPVQVFINGEPYAVLNLREPSNKDFAYTNYGIDTDEMDQFEMSPDSSYIQKRGTKEAFNKLLELSEQAATDSIYQQVRELLDIDDFINYMAIQFYIANSDWPFNNVKAFRDRKQGRFHFVLFDLDGVFNIKSPFDIFFGMETRQFDPLYGYDYSKDENIDGIRLVLPVELVTLFKNLLRNTAFHKRFIDTICIVGGSVFKQDHVVDVMDDVNERMSKGGLQDPSGMTNYFKRVLSLDFNLNRMKELEASPEIHLTDSRRKVKICSNLSNATLLINQNEIPYSDFDGFLYGKSHIQAIAPIGYHFIGWKDTDKDIIISTSPGYSLPECDTLELMAWFSPSTDCKIPPVRINEISANNTIFVNEYYKKNDWIELYNTSDTAYDISGMYISDDITNPQKYKITSSDHTATSYTTIIPPHGHIIIWADKLASVSQIHCDFKLSNKDNETVLLTAADGSWQDVFKYSSHTSQSSCGRFPDGNDNIYILNVPTIGKKNQIDNYHVAINLTDLYGDVNSDGTVDISDVVAVINHIAGVQFYKKSDVNNDNNVDISDVVAIINVISTQ